MLHLGPEFLNNKYLRIKPQSSRILSSNRNNKSGNYSNFLNNLHSVKKSVSYHGRIPLLIFPSLTDKKCTRRENIFSILLSSRITKKHYMTGTLKGNNPFSRTRKIEKAVSYHSVIPNDAKTRSSAWNFS